MKCSGHSGSNQSQANERPNVRQARGWSNSSSTSRTHGGPSLNLYANGLEIFASLYSSDFQLPNSLCGCKSGRAQKWPHLRDGILYCSRSNINNSPPSPSLPLSVSSALHSPPELAITYVILMSPCTPRKSRRVLDQKGVHHAIYYLVCFPHWARHASTLCKGHFLMR